MKMAIVSEAWNEKEEKYQTTFPKEDSRWFNYLLMLAGISRKDVLITSVFKLRPRPTNKIENLCGPKETAIKGMPMLERGKYVQAKYEPELLRLRQQLTDFNPNVTIALGNTPLWALTKQTGIKRYRGAPTLGYGDLKILPTYHPLMVNRNRKDLPILLSDLQKAKAEAEFPDLRRPQRFIHVEPDYADILEFEREYLTNATSISIDIETAGNQITEIGFAPTIDRALVIPFFDDRKADKNYWPDLKTEVLVWKWVKKICERKFLIYVGQNYNYDMRFLLESYGIKCSFANHDTMLLHHAMQPEMEKGLGLLGSLYTNERAWKFMRPKHTVKEGDV